MSASTLPFLVTFAIVEIESIDNIGSGWAGCYDVIIGLKNVGKIIVK